MSKLTEKHPLTNSLINESSPYLLQHAHNPVNWMAWGDEALQKAKKEDKLIIVSIGYSACHWCHVMEHESFEDEEVARMMNHYFVSIKVDREERPDVDHLYMDAVHLIGGQGGWPLNCIALPNGKPVYGGTYFRKGDWINLLKQLRDLYKLEKQKVVGQAEQITKGILKQNIIDSTTQQQFSRKTLHNMVDNWSKEFDSVRGGNNRAPKFPMPNNYLFLLQYAFYTKDKAISTHLELTLDRMAAGGIYDHIGGGFARYSTDAYWKVPHFEKMLYDNAQLISLYSDAYRFYRKDRYKQVVQESIAFIERELKAPNGGYFAALDADSEGEEGAFYIWTKDEIDTLLGHDAELFCRYYNIKENGNWEPGKNVVYNTTSIEQIALEYKLSEVEVLRKLHNARKILFAYRNKRERPGTDTKIITAWNAQLLTGFCKAYKALRDPKHLKLATELAHFLQTERSVGSEKIVRIQKNNTDRIYGYLDDYSLLIEAYIELFQVSFKEKWIQHAKTLLSYVLANFYDESSGLFWYSEPNTTRLVASKFEISDNVIPASNSVLANNLLKLSWYFGNPEWKNLAEKMLNTVIPQMEQHGSYFTNWAILLQDIVEKPYEIVFAGPKALELKQEFDANYTPYQIAGGITKNNLPVLEGRVTDENLIYVCKNNTCKLPVSSVKEAIEQIDNNYGKSLLHN